MAVFTTYLFFLMLWFFFALVGYYISVAYLVGSSEESILMVAIVAAWVIALLVALFWKYVIGRIIIPTVRRQPQEDPTELQDNTAKSEGIGSGFLFILIAIILYFMMKS